MRFEWTKGGGKNLEKVPGSLLENQKGITIQSAQKACALFCFYKLVYPEELKDLSGVIEGET